MAPLLYNEYDYCGQKIFRQSDYNSKLLFWNDLIQYIKDNDYKVTISSDDDTTIRVTVIGGDYKDYTQSIVSVDSTFDTGGYDNV